MNDENIKILEKLLNQKYDDELLNTLEMISKEDEVYILTIFEKQAIKNLLKENEELREKVKELKSKLIIAKGGNDYWCQKYCEVSNSNKELEEENTVLKKANNISEDVKIEDITKFINKSIEDFNKEYIPVAKIKEKIKELEKERQKYREENTRIDEDYFFDINGFDNAILVLQELLEGK